MTSLKLVNGKNPRQIALSILQARRHNGEFTETLLERALAPDHPSSQSSAQVARAGRHNKGPAVRQRPASSMSAADRALCQELVYGVVRAQAALDWLIGQKTAPRKQNAGIQNLLRLGLYQVFWLDRIPPHAAVHETVELAKREGFGPKAGFVNAVLRGFLREFDATKNRLGDLKVSHPAIAFSHPQWLVEKWRKRFGMEQTRQLLQWNNTPPKIFARVNTLKAEPGKLLEKWRDEDVEYDFVRREFLLDRPADRHQGTEPLDRQLKPPGLPGGATPSLDPETLVFELKSHPSLASLESFRDGWFYVQDPGT
ncbi:MAG TPA: transcription antitermination factor NusB, partial [Verrucomicrobiae bacterium]|nr:transcription antitermination factor NusB [Verrucomicrobiae bacterium]